MPGLVSTVPPAMKLPWVLRTIGLASSAVLRSFSSALTGTEKIDAAVAASTTLVSNAGLNPRSGAFFARTSSSCFTFSSGIGSRSVGHHAPGRDDVNSLKPGATGGPQRSRRPSRQHAAASPDWSRSAGTRGATNPTSGNCPNSRSRRAGLVVEVVAPVPLPATRSRPSRDEARHRILDTRIRRYRPD
jgi:hypothetical protein